MTVAAMAGPAVEAGAGVRGIVGIGAQTFGGAKSFADLMTASLGLVANAKIQGPAGVNLAASFEGRGTGASFILSNIDGANAWGIWNNSGNYAMNFTASNQTPFQILPGVAILTSAQQPFRADAATGNNGFLLFTLGARLKFSDGGTTNYLYGTGTTRIIAAGDFDVAVSLSAAGGTFIANGITGESSQQAGSAPTAPAKIGGALNSQHTPVGNVGAGEDDLQVYTLPASALVTTGRGVLVRFKGTLANNANAKTLKVYFGASLITITLPTSIAGNYHGEMTVMRTGASTQRYAIEVTVANTGTNAVAGLFTAQGTTAQTETAAITIKRTATATANDDVVENMSVVEFI